MWDRWTKKKKLLRWGALLVVALGMQRRADATDVYVAPQFDVYVTHNALLRSHAIVSGNWLVDGSKFSSAWAQYDMDIGLFAYFRRYVFKDPNWEKSKRVTFRVGYLQVSDLTSAPNGFDEKRPFLEFTFRLPGGRTWLFEDRNREEFRYFDSKQSTRYRNRLRGEHSMVVNGFRMIPYGTGEIFYDGDEDRWNEFQTAFGVDFPWSSNSVLELETMAQFVDGVYSTLSFGIVFQKHL